MQCEYDIRVQSDSQVILFLRCVTDVGIHKKTGWIERSDSRTWQEENPRQGRYIEASSWYSARNARHAIGVQGHKVDMQMYRFMSQSFHLALDFPWLMTYPCNLINWILCRLQAEFDIDREQRVRRENEMIKQLTDHEQLVSSQYENQIVSRNLTAHRSCNLILSCKIIICIPLFCVSALTWVTISSGSWGAWREY